MSGTTGYTKNDEAQLEKFVSDTLDGGGQSGVRLDSATAAASALDAFKNESGDGAPRVLDELLGLSTDEQKITKAIFDGVATFEREHGFRPTGDLILSAIHQGKTLFDSLNNAHHDQISMNPNAPLVAIMGAFAEATPFAGYLPADKGSNEAKLIVVNHVAGSDWNEYAAGDSMDGVQSGLGYLSSARVKELNAPNDTTNYKFTFRKRNDDVSPAVELLRGRTIVYVNGQRAIAEVQNGGAAQATVGITGYVKLGNTEYTLTGTVKPAAGEVVVTPSPAFPANTNVTVEAFVDYEKNPVEFTPRLAVNALSYSLFANPFRGLYSITPEARSQFANEVGVDAGAEAMLVMRGQFATERHYDAIKKAKMVGKFISPYTYDYSYAAQILQKTRAQIWQDFGSHVGALSQKMAEETGDHGITHMYVGKTLAAQWTALPRDQFEPSGVSERPGIYRLGRLLGKYEVYYTPKHAEEFNGGESAQIICVGRSTQTARCPVIFGDASAPTFEQLGLGENMKSGYAFHARTFTALNPHDLSAKGCALITVTNLK